MCGIHLGHLLLGSRSIKNGIKSNMHGMNPLLSKLFGDRLGQSSQGMFATSKLCSTIATTKCRSCLKASQLKLFTMPLKAAIQSHSLMLTSIMRAFDQESQNPTLQGSHADAILPSGAEIQMRKSRFPSSLRQNLHYPRMQASQATLPVNKVVHLHKRHRKSPWTSQGQFPELEYQIHHHHNCRPAHPPDQPTVQLSNSPWILYVRMHKYFKTSFNGPKCEWLSL